MTSYNDKPTDAPDPPPLYSPLPEREAPRWKVTSSNYLVNHWRGELPLGVAFWLNGFLLSLGSSGLLLLVMGNWDYLPYETVSLIFWAIVVVVFVPLSVWQVVGIWRSADRHQQRGGQAIWATLAKVAIVLGLLRLVVGVLV